LHRLEDGGVREGNADLSIFIIANVPFDDNTFLTIELGYAVLVAGKEICRGVKVVVV
jgi:hypothetical protein